MDGHYTVSVPGGAGPSTTFYQRSFTAGGGCTVTAYVSGGAVGTVRTSGTSVSWAGGTKFNANGQWSGLTITINALNYTIASCTSELFCTTTTTAGVQVTPVSYSINPAPSELFSDNAGTPLANPFTANIDGYWFFYTNNQVNDVVLTGGGFPAPLTLGAIQSFDSSGACSGVSNIICQGGNAFGTSVNIGSTDIEPIKFLYNANQAGLLTTTSLTLTGYLTTTTPGSELGNNGTAGFTGVILNIDHIFTNPDLLPSVETRALQVVNRNKYITPEVAPADQFAVTCVDVVVSAPTGSTIFGQRKGCTSEMYFNGTGYTVDKVHNFQADIVELDAGITLSDWIGLIVTSPPAGGTITHGTGITISDLTATNPIGDVRAIRLAGTGNSGQIQWPSVAITESPSGYLQLGASSGVVTTVGLTVGIGANRGVNAGSVAVAGTTLIFNDLSIATPSTISGLRFTNTCGAIPPAPAVGTVTLFCRSSDNLEYYIDSGGNVTGPLGTGGGGGTFWKASITAHGTNSNSVKTYIGGNNTAAADMGFVTNESERMTILGAGNIGIGTTSPGRALEVSASGGIPLRVTGPASGGAGVEIELKETTTLSASLIAQYGTTFAISAYGTTPIDFFTNSNKIISLYRASGDSIGQFQGAAEWAGVNTGAVGIAGANNGRIIFDKQLGHFYASESGNAYFQINAGSGGTGWPIGSAANSGVYNNPGTGPYFIGLLNTGGFEFSTASTDAGGIDTNQRWFVNTTAPCCTPNNKTRFTVSQIAGDTDGGIAIMTPTGTSATFSEIVNGTAMLQLYADDTNSHLKALSGDLQLQSGASGNFNIYTGATVLAMTINSFQRSMFNTATEFAPSNNHHRITVSSSDYGQLALINSTTSSSILTLATTLAGPTITPSGELKAGGGVFFINTAGHSTAQLNFGTGASRTLAMGIDSSQNIFMFGNLTLSAGTLTVAGAATFSSTATVTGNLTVNSPSVGFFPGGITLAGSAATFSGAGSILLLGTGVLTIGNNITVTASGNSTVTGTLNTGVCSITVTKGLITGSSGC